MCVSASLRSELPPLRAPRAAPQIFRQVSRLFSHQALQPRILMASVQTRAVRISVQAAATAQAQAAVRQAEARAAQQDLSKSELVFLKIFAMLHVLQDNLRDLLFVNGF